MEKLLLLCVFACAIRMYAFAVPTGCTDPAGCNPELSCEGDGRFRSSCNWCRCVGGRSLCTKRGCPPGLAERLEGEPECEGNVTFHRECNTCSCVNGRAICTTKHCGPSGLPSEISVTVTEERAERGPTDTEPECTPGSRWRVDCNWCTCNELGLGICTKKGCPPVPTDEQRNEPNCEGSSRWREECNWCSCVDGRGLCTLKACEVDKAPPPPSDASISDPSKIPNPPEREVRCTNGSRYRDECNWCSCSESGFAMCTMMGCTPEIMERFKNEPECIGDARWMRDCNWCNCLNGNAVCTLKECMPEFDITVIKRDDSEEPGCTKGSEWREHCNWCSCSETGIPGCTEKGCLMPPEDIKEPECKGNAQWKRDCNLCRCVEGRAVCTEKACLGDASDTCVEGTTWDVGCNSCVCQNGRSLCTEKDCQPDGSTSECSPNSSWKDDCNTCSCKNGRPVCTRMFCTSPSHCYLPPVELDGPLCEGLLQKWTFDSSAHQCKSIVYGGCGGTANLFDSEYDCLTSCVSPSGGGSLKKGIGAKDLGQQAGEDVAKSQKRCLLPLDEGPCFGALPYFFYNKVTGKCERFTYGGCQGNANRFFSIEECQETCAGIAPATDETCNRSQCPWKRWGHYLAKGCLPQYDGSACCPTRFLCSSYDESQGNKTQCIYRNRAYDIGERLEVSDECSAGCLCAESYSAELPEILCASVECPDLFHPHPPGCRPLYRLGQCCAYDYDCGLETRAQTCFWNNRTYHEGDQMYFDEYPCQRCICSSDFTDPFGPGCVKIDCGFEFRYTNRYDHGCVPIFFKENCCPIDWLCPDDSRIAEVEDIIMEDEVNPCILDKDPGSCYNDVTRIYYDAEASECRQFVYGGCQGNMNNFRSFEECEEFCRKTPRPSLSECQIGGSVSTGPSKPQNVKVTALVNSGLPGRMSLQVEWSPPKCPRGSLKGYQVWVQALGPKDKPHLDKSNASKFTGPLITQLAYGGLYLDQSYTIAVAAENEQELGDISPLVVFSLIPNYRRGDQCHLGSISLEVGKSLQLSNCQIDCRCITPPEFTCAMLDNCEAVKEKQSYKDCPEISCSAECTPLTDTLSGCLTCSCKNQSFTCPELQCSPSCGTSINYETGCPECSCQCPVASGQTSCPDECTVVRDSNGCPVSCDCNLEGFGFSSFDNCTEDPHCPENCTVHSEAGCAKCDCNSSHLGNSTHMTRRQVQCPQNPPCPMDCGVIRQIDQNTGCLVCICDPRNTGNPFFPAAPLPPRRPRRCPTGRPPCPQDCAVRYVINRNTGCLVCTCTHNSGNPFVTVRPPPPTRQCPLGPDGRPPCPQDCTVIQTVDQNSGCLICTCDPNSTGNPFVPVNPPTPNPFQTCPTGPDGKPPCPQDCGVIQTVDQKTGCSICICDPNDTGNPFGPSNPPPPTRRTRTSCPANPDGKPPCPQDCGVIQTVDEKTGCNICICDPNDTGNPFGLYKPPPPPPPTRSCPTNPDGKPPCPQDCGVIQTVDEKTGCSICICDPNDTGNPFGPLNPPPLPPPTRSCPTNPDGKPPCPQDCGVIQTVDQNTGCNICICDPNDTGNPFGPFNPPPPPPPTRSCPTNPDGKPPCPQDCGVIQTVDQNTGCRVCICDPNDTGNPFVPINPPPPSY
ncbi:balbiani ring protein 3-like isoform X2 [Macrobrachium nipponense]|uniref:balbiani ring protein 3-like isoform X2 n=1 Tax=Macrobrachium nipponense TaxID=159736 RepID=UPI0030C84207